MVNIPHSTSLQDDPRPRYVRDPLLVTTSGKYHVVTNFRSVCRQLKLNTFIQEMNLVNYFKLKLKQSVSFDLETGHLKVKGLLVNPDTILEKFIQEKILCSECQSPKLEAEHRC